MIIGSRIYDWQYEPTLSVMKNRCDVPDAIIRVPGLERVSDIPTSVVLPDAVLVELTVISNRPVIGKTSSASLRRVVAARLRRRRLDAAVNVSLTEAVEESREVGEARPGSDRGATGPEVTAPTLPAPWVVARKRYRATTKRAPLGAIGLPGIGTLADCTGASGDGPRARRSCRPGSGSRRSRRPTARTTTPSSSPTARPQGRISSRRSLRRAEYTAPTGEAPLAFERLRGRVEAQPGTCGELAVSLERNETCYRVAPVNGDDIIALASPTTDGG